MVYGQDYETTREANFKDDITKVFQNVSVSSVSSGFLTDIGMHFEEITDFSQQTLTDKNLTDIDIFGGVFASFVDCNIDPSKQFPSSDAYFLAHKTYTPTSGNNQLAFILQDFHSLKKDAIGLNLLTTQNNQLFDVQGRSSLPFDQDTAFICSFVGTELVGNTMIVSFPTQLRYGQFVTQVSSLQVDWDNGQGYQIVSLSTTTSVTYANDGLHKVRFRCQLANGSIFESHTKLQVNISAQKYSTDPDHIETIQPSALQKCKFLKYLPEEFG